MTEEIRNAKPEIRVSPEGPPGAARRSDLGFPVLDFLVLLCALTFPAVMAWVYFIVLAGRAGEVNPALLAAFGCGKVLQFTFPILYVRLVEGRRVWPTRPTGRGLGLGLAFGVLVTAGMLGLYAGWLQHSPLASQTPAKVYAKVQEYNLATPAGFVGMALFISVLHSLLEEYYWRWFVFGGLRRHLPLGLAVAGSSLGFMAHHVIVLGVYFPGQFFILALPFSLAVAAGGAFWAWLYERSGSLYGPWLSHLVIDLGIMAVGYHMVSRFWA